MFLHIHEKENSHYFYVMAWRSKDRVSGPIKKKRFDIYDRAVEYFEDLELKYSFVELFEVIGGKRKWIADSDDVSRL